MKVVNYEALTNMWNCLSMRYGNKPISSLEFQDLCKRFHISLSNGLKNAYESVNIITCPCRGQVVVASSISKEQVIRAYEAVRESRKAYRKQLDGVHAFNISVEARNNPDFTPEACAKYLQQHGWFVYKPSKGERITVSKEYKY